MLSRRNFVISAATASAVLGLDKPVEFISSAAAQKAPAPAAAMKYKTFKLGDVQVTTIYDGLWEKPHDPGFIANASLDDTKKALQSAKLTDAHVPIPFTVTFIKKGNNTIMFDSGTGGQAAPTAGQLAGNMKEAGVDPASIKQIIVTHYHGDHIFGLMAKETNAQTFPNAEIVVPAAEHKYWSDPAVFNTLAAPRHNLAKRIQASISTWKNVRQVEADKDVASGIRAIATHGHTPGHTSYLVSSGKNLLLVSGDVTNIPALFVKNPNWRAAFDQDGAMAETSRKRIFDRAIADKMIVTGYHWGMPGAGTLAKDGNGYAFKPIG